MDIQEVVRLHGLWLEGKEGGVRADLRGANLRRANLRGAILYNASLDGADLRGADLDMSSGLPLWCGGLDVALDDRLVIQELFHLMNHVQSTTKMDKELKALLSTDELRTWANKFHRAEVTRLTKE